jgi:threonine 3-dehydrogenase
MKALVKSKAEPGIWMSEVPMPMVGHNDVLIKITHTSICGTDMHIYHWDEWAKENIPVPLVVGHEFVGEIVEVGKYIDQFKLGDRVSGENHVACGFCRCCRSGQSHLCRKNVSIGVNIDGCFAEYLAMPAVNAYPIPDNVSNEIASILNPLGNAVHTALAFNIVGEDILITGAGPVGMMATAVARKAGARHIVICDVNEHRLDLAKKMGATFAINPSKVTLNDVMSELKMREGFDVGLEMSGNASAFNNMINFMNHAGKIAMLGFLPRETQIDWNQIIMKGLTLKGIYGREMFETWYKMVCMLQSGLDILPVITHEFSFKDYEKVFEVMHSGKSGKVIMTW